MFWPAVFPEKRERGRVPGPTIALHVQEQHAIAAPQTPAPPQQTTPSPSTKAASTTSAPAQPSEKPKHVITNDEIKPSPFADFGGRFFNTMGLINDCDASCFDQIRVLSHVDISKSATDWRREVLKEIDAVRSNSDWQAYLHQLYDAHNTVCQLKKDRQDELNVGGMRRNVSPEDIAIAEKYDRKDQAAQDQLAALVAQQAVRQKLFQDKPYATAFSTLQGMRMQCGTCAPIVIIYHQ